MLKSCFDLQGVQDYRYGADIYSQLRSFLEAPVWDAHLGIWD